MTIAEINKFPKSKKKLSEFVRELLQGWNSMVSQGEEQPVEITDQMSEQAIEGLIWSNERILYDFFDSQKIHMFVEYNTETWAFFINDLQGLLDIDFFSRKEAEKSGFLEAFKILEQTL